MWKWGLLVLLAAPLPLFPAEQTGEVAFDWFEYAGRDAVFATPLPAGHYRNPVLAGFYPDPTICRVGDDYYLVNSSFAYFPGLPVFRSRDLVNWTQIGHAIDRPGQLDYTGLGVGRGLFAPALSHRDGVFYLVCTMVGAGGNFLITATNPAGPWSDPVWLDFEGIDPSLFFDDDGRAWMLNNGAPAGEPLYDGHRAIWIQEFDLATRSLVGPRTQLVNGGVDITKKPVWIEGPHLYRRGDWYYLCCAEGGTSVQHSQVIYRGRSPTGPFAPWEGNPILTQRDLDGSVPQAVTCTGHADLVEGPDGRWWSVFLGCRPHAGGNWFTGRETFLLPVRWTDDGWPMILPPGERVPAIVAAPNAAEPSAGPLPLNGNFTWRDEFDADALSPAWIEIRTSPEPRWRLEPAQGLVALVPSPDGLSGAGRPAFLGRRVQHGRFRAAVSLTVPADSRVTAGLAAFQKETQHFYLGVRRNGDWMSVFVERLHEGRREVLANQVVAAVPRLVLEIAAEETHLAFSFGPPGAPLQRLLAGADSFPLTVQAAGGGVHFTGATVGPHARLGP